MQEDFSSRIVPTHHQSIKRNASTSPLLRLPGEIREIIFKYVIGGNLFHIKLYQGLYKKNTPARTNGKLRHEICVAEMSENKAYERLISAYDRVPPGDASQYHTLACQERHKSCILTEHFDFIREVATVQEARRLDLSILGACRQMYEEANILLWTTNTFSFSDVLTFEELIARLNTMQRQKLSAIHIGMAWFRTLMHHRRASSVHNPMILEKLRGLRTVHLSLDRDPSFDCWSQGNIVNIGCFRSLQILPLKHATVMVVDIFDGAPQGRWTIRRKRDCAERLRCMLLNPDGDKIYRAEYQAKQVALETIAAQRREERESLIRREE